jgi:hypothetical protein
VIDLIGMPSKAWTDVRDSQAGSQRGEEGGWRNNDIISRFQSDYCGRSFRQTNIDACNGDVGFGHPYEEMLRGIWKIEGGDGRLIIWQNPTHLAICIGQSVLISFVVWILWVLVGC